MPFSPKTKTEMFVRCGRLCCLCLKQCGTNIEAAHIVDEARGGSNDIENGIPACLDCHQEIGAYNESHPRGNKFRPEELRARRDRVYALVETGVVYAQVIAQKARAAHVQSELPTLDQPGTPSELSGEAGRFLNVILSRSGAATARKLALLNDQDRAHILDELLRAATTDASNIEGLAEIVQSPAFPHEQAQLLVEQLVRAITLYGDIPAKAKLLEVVSDELLGSVLEGVRLASFEELIAIVERDQYEEVNAIIPALVSRVTSIPPELHGTYVQALVNQAGSHSFKGAPAARSALAALPDAVAKAGLEAFGVDFVIWKSRYDYFRQFVGRYKHLVTGSQRKILDDLVLLSYSEFARKYISEGGF